MSLIPVYLVDDGTVSLDSANGTRMMIGYAMGLAPSGMYVAIDPQTTCEFPTSLEAAKDRIMADAVAEARRLLEESLGRLGEESVQLKVLSVSNDGLIEAQAVGYAPAFGVSVRFAKYPDDCPCGISARDCDYHKDAV